MPQHVELAKLYEEAVILVSRHLVLRYLVLSMMTAVTLMGLFGIGSCGRWVSRRIASDPLRSAVATKPASAAATA